MPLLQKLRERIRALFARFFPPKLPEPGRFVSGSKFSWRGFLSSSPWQVPQREYLVYVPAGVGERFSFRRHPLLVLIHGCRQTPEEIAAATRITQLADTHRLLVLLPRQAERANSWGCWNWFDHATVRGWGETAIVAAHIRAVRRDYRIDKKRVFVAGMSAGGALAAVLGIRRPDLVAGVFIHSGLACGAASTPYHAIDVMKTGPDGDVLLIGRHAREEADPRHLPVPIFAMHGERDDVVKPINTVELVRQYLALNGHPAVNATARGTLPPPDRQSTLTTAQGRSVTTNEWLVDGLCVATHVQVDGLGHAWSGGDEQYPYNDPQEPHATELLAAFIGGR